MITLLFLSFSWLKVLAWVGSVLFMLGLVLMILALLLFAGLKAGDFPEEEIDVNAPQYDDEEDDS